MNLSQYIHIAFELWSAFFCIIALICVLTARFHDRNKTKLLGLQLFLNALLNVSDMLAYLFRGDTSTLGFFMVRISNFSVFMTNHLILMAATHYICYRMGSKSGKGTALIRRIVTVLCFSGIGLLILSRIFGFYYAFDEQNRYYRLTGSFWLLLLIQLIIIMIMAGFTIFHWKNFKPLEKVAYLSYEVLPIVAIGFQTFIYGISLSTVSSTFSVLLMFIIYEREF